MDFDRILVPHIIFTLTVYYIGHWYDIVEIFVLFYPGLKAFRTSMVSPRSVDFLILQSYS